MAQSVATIAPELLRLADIWPGYQGQTEIREDPDSSNPSRMVTVPCRRCLDCDGMIYPDDATGRLGHLLQSHGFRMDGTAYDNDNQIITTAAKELIHLATR